jgi:hypothetical protein
MKNFLLFAFVAMMITSSGCIVDPLFEREDTVELTEFQGLPHNYRLNSGRVVFRGVLSGCVAKGEVFVIETKIRLPDGNKLALVRGVKDPRVRPEMKVHDRVDIFYPISGDKPGFTDLDKADIGPPNKRIKP